MDIDMVVTQNLIRNCHRNAQQGRYSWYPIPYSQYDPNYKCKDEAIKQRTKYESRRFNSDYHNDFIGQRKVPDIQDDYFVGREEGFWRDFGFGLTCMYKSDFLESGGFDLSIQGWGEEDIRLYVSLLESGLNVIRANQEDLVHIFHSKSCSRSLDDTQYNACRRTKASHYASQHCLVKKWFELDKIEL